MANLNDMALITQVRVFHNKRAFDSLVRKYQSPVRRFFLNQTGGDAPLSDDLAQETFIKAYTGLDSFKNAANFQTWLFRIAYNVFYDYFRSRKLTDDLDTAVVDAHHQTMQPDSGTREDIYNALKLLTEEERTCVTMRFMEDFSIEKIAGITGLPAGTVKSHIFRGKNKLAAYLKDNGYDR